MGFFINNFETVYGSKGNIQALRNKVLELAIQGKLVERDSNDEPASELVKRIKVERDRLIKEGKIKKEKTLPTIEEDKVPFEIPESWEWVKLGGIVELVSGRDESVNDCNSEGVGIPYVMGASNIDNNKFIVERWIKKPKVTSNIGDLVITVKGTVGKYFVNEMGEINLSRQVMAIRLINKEMLNYLTVWFQSYIVELNTKSKGLIPGISREDILDSLIPIPPFAEQQRILCRIKSLMTEIDKLEEKLYKKEYMMKLLPEAVVDAIGKCQNDEELKEQLQSIIENFETIYQTPESMQELRNIILQLAIEGKLVPQDKNDESALELVKRIKVEKDRLVKEGKIKKEKPLSKIKEDEIPFEIPESWEWGRLATVIDIIYGGGTPDKSNPEYWNGNIKWASVKDFSDSDMYLNDTIDSITENGLNNSSSKIVNKGNFIISTRMGIGRIVKSNIEVAINQDLKGVIITPYFNNKLFYYFYKSLKIEGTGTTVKGIKQEELLNIPFPIPPLNEQKRIVQKVQSIMKLIDQMENQLKRKNILVEKMASV